jgi:hypothetical protein
VAYTKEYSPELLDYQPVSTAVTITGRPRRARYNVAYTNASFPLTATITNPLITYMGDFTFSLVAGFLPDDLEFYETGVISGTPILHVFEDGNVHENSYPIHESTVDRYYFVVGAQANSRPEYGEAVCCLDVQKNWCDIRDEFTQKVKNQSLAIDNVKVTNQEFLDYRKEIGDYFCR